MTKAQQAKADLIKENKANYDDLVAKIEGMSSPSERDVNYLQGIMKGKKYTREQRKELTDKLSQMELEAQKPKSTVVFETSEPVAPQNETPAMKEVADKVSTAKKLTMAEVMGTDEAPMSNRAKMFEEVRVELFALADKCISYSRKSSGGTAMRLARASTELSRLAKTQLRD